MGWGRVRVGVGGGVNNLIDRIKFYSPVFMLYLQGEVKLYSAPSFQIEINAIEQKYPEKSTICCKKRGN